MNYAETRRGYDNLWRQAELRPEHKAAAQAVARRLAASRERYERAALGSMPWYWVAITHNLESGASFTRHLHNGDPLTARTRQVPAGRPTGTPPFTWEESARDALTMKELDKVSEWPVSRVLFEFERYNGFGYVARRINSPYLWSFTTLYERGKYVADGQFSALAVSGQCGAAATLKAMVSLRMVSLASEASPIIEATFPDLVAPSAPVMIPSPPLPSKGRENFLIDIWNWIRK